MIEALLAGLAGLLIGSFLNVCIYRMPLDLSIVTPRSFCPDCDHGIAWYDNIPLLSYLLLRGKCRHCQARISLRYPIVEFLTGALFFLAVWLRPRGIDAMAIKYCAFSAIIVGLVFTDLEALILPDEFTYGGIGLGLVFAFITPLDPLIGRIFFYGVIQDDRVLSLIESAFAASFCSFALWLIGFLYQKVRHRDGLGLGDVKMVAAIGAFLGLQSVLMTLMVGSLLGAVIGLGYILIARKNAATYELPFGAFLGFAALVAAFLQEFQYGRVA